MANDRPVAERKRGVAQRTKRRRSVAFLVEATIELTEADVRVIVPEWWEVVKQTKLRVKARVKSSSTSVFGLDALLDFDWRIATNGVELTEQQFAELVAQNVASCAFAINGCSLILRLFNAFKR